MTLRNAPPSASNNSKAVVLQVAFSKKCFYLFLVPCIADFEYLSHIFTFWRSYSMILVDVGNFRATLRMKNCFRFLHISVYLVENVL